MDIAPVLLRTEEQGGRGKGMNNDDERDFEEERFNASLGREEGPEEVPAPDDGTREMETSRKCAIHTGDRAVSFALIGIGKAILFTGSQVTAELERIASKLEFIADHWRVSE